MYLNYSMSSYKGKTYKSYPIAESYREGGKVKKNAVWRIGELTAQQVDQIQLILGMAKTGDQIATRIKGSEVQEGRKLLDDRTTLIARRTSRSAKKAVVTPLETNKLQKNALMHVVRRRQNQGRNGPCSRSMLSGDSF